MNEQPADDMTIIQAVVRGNQRAYATLVVRYSQYVFTLVMRYVNNREIAEELSQDVFVKAYRCLADFRGAGKFSTWLYTIVHSTCLSYLRNKRQAHLLPGDDKITLFTEGINENDPGDILEKKSQGQIIDKAINLLPESDRQIITLFYQAGQSVEEIGVIMGMTAGNVKVKLFRARQKLKELLTPVL